MADLNTLNAVNADGYFKEDLKVDVGSFSLDMLDDMDDSKSVLEDDELVDVKKNKPEEDDQD
jgi:hypothetical protein